MEPPAADTGGNATPPAAATCAEDVLDDGHALVVPSGTGLLFLDGDGAPLAAWSWPERVESCTSCFAEGASWDGTHWLATWAQVTGLGEVTGGVVTLDAGGTTVAETLPFNFPHDVFRDPRDGGLVVAETFSSRVTWTPEGGDGTPYRTIDRGTEGWEAGVPNGMQFLQWDGRDLLLLTLRGDNYADGGRVLLWDITERDAPRVVWAFPAEGQLNTPHGARLLCHDGGWLLLVAHTLAMGRDGGTVLVARADAPTSPPAYLADLAPPPDEAPLAFARSAVLDGPDLIVTDSGLETLNTAGPPGRILRVPLPDLEPSGATGDALTGQEVVEVPGWQPLREDLLLPFEAWIGPLPAD